MKSISVPLTVGLCLGLLVVGVGGNPAFGACIIGTVVYEGKAPKLKAITMDADPVCASKHTETVRVEVLVLGEGQTMANVFVYVKSGLSAKTHETPAEPVVIDQVGCMYTPHVFGIRAGQPLKILNSDGTLHNIHALSKINRPFNIAMPETKLEASEVFTKEEFMFKIKCDVHPWMGAWVTVLSHPFFDVTTTDGTFEITGLPAGTYEIEAWHEKLDALTTTVTLADGAEESLDLTFSK